MAFANGHGAVDLLADLVGYFDPVVNDGMTALDPFRLLDTRTDGGRLGPESSLDLQVTDVGGVPADAIGVALNITATRPTDHSFLTVWPTGESLPTASSLNMRPDQTVPNLVFARVGDGGRISIFNRYGSVDVVVDVLGCFRPDAARFVPLTPARLLDTRIGNGCAARARSRRAHAHGCRARWRSGGRYSGVVECHRRAAVGADVRNGVSNRHNGADGLQPECLAGRGRPEHGRGAASEVAATCSC